MGEAKFEFSRQEVEELFKFLEQVLSVIPLKRESGEKAYVPASEFMLMHQEGTAIGFKHRNTRNYVFLDTFSGRLTVPETEKPFMRGYF